MTKHIKEFDDICYKRNFLDRVIIRIDFAAPIKELRKPPKELEQYILGFFPIPEPQKKINTTFHVNLKDPNAQVSKSEKVTTWVFHSKDRTQTLELSDGFFVLSFYKYNTFEEMKKLFSNILSKIIPLDSNINSQRIGMRYINVFNFNDGEPSTSFEKYFNPNLVCMIDIIEDKEAISRAFNSIVINYGDVSLLMQYGIFNPDYPAIVRKKEFIIDIDAYYEGLVELTELDDEINKFHFRIQNLFESLLTDETRQEMN